MPEFKLTTIERWEHKVYYEPVEAETALQAWEMVKAGEVSWDEQDVMEAGDDVLYCTRIAQDGSKIDMPPEIPHEQPMPVINDPLAPRELATVLAALRCLRGRFFQPYLCGDWTDAERVAAIKRSFTEFADTDPLCPEEIDALCERINVTV
jgi:hypothetical protein